MMNKLVPLECKTSSEPSSQLCVSRCTRMECPTFARSRKNWAGSGSFTSEYDLAIYGAGLRGLSAAAYAASEGLKQWSWNVGLSGGKQPAAPRLENYLGFPAGISGAELAERAREQACKFGAEILLPREGVRGEFPLGKRVGYLADAQRSSHAQQFGATGIRYHRLGVPTNKNS